MRGGTPLHPLRPPYSPCPCGGRSLCRMTCTLSAARRRGQSARIFPLRGRYARLLRRSRVAGITSASRLAGLMGLFAAFALSGGAPSPALRFHLERRGAISSVSTPTSDFYFSCAGWWLLPGVRASPPGGILFSFLTLDCGFCPVSGRGRLRGGRQGAGKAIINKVAVRNLQSFAIKTQHTFNIFFLLYCWLSKFTNFGIKILTIHGVWTISFQTKFNKFPYQKREIFLYFPRI